MSRYTPSPEPLPVSTPDIQTAAPPPPTLPPPPAPPPFTATTISVTDADVATAADSAAPRRHHAAAGTPRATACLTALSRRPLSILDDTTDPSR